MPAAEIIRLVASQIGQISDAVYHLDPDRTIKRTWLVGTRHAGKGAKAPDNANAVVLLLAALPEGHLWVS